MYVDDSMNVVVSGGGKIKILNIYIFYGMILCLLQKPSSDMDEIREADRPATADETREYERVRELWRADQERKRAAAQAEEPRDPEAEWLPISISRARGQNTADTDGSELTEWELSTIEFLMEDSAEKDREPTPPPEQDLPKLVPQWIEPHEDYLNRRYPTNRRGRPRTRPSPSPVREPTPRRWIRGRPEPISPTREDDPEEVHIDPLEDWPTTRHVRPQTSLEPESADVDVLTWRGIEIGPATASDAKLVVDILAAIRDEAPREEREWLMRAVLGLPDSYEPK